jgi:phosphoenolpyruvate-protein kinase (PTS system EI component)
LETERKRDISICGEFVLEEAMVPVGIYYGIHEFALFVFQGHC